MESLSLKTSIGIVETQPYQHWLEARLPFWTGRVLVVSFDQIKIAMDKIDEASKANAIDYNTKCAGVYILLGKENGKPSAYIGQAEKSIEERLPQSCKEQEAEKWCEEAILVIETGSDLGETYAKYLESCLIQIAKDVGKVQLSRNKQIPKSKLSDTRSKMLEDGFINKLFIVLKSLRVTIFQDKKHASERQDDEKSISSTSSVKIFELVSKKGNYYGKVFKRRGEVFDARLRIEGEKFIILEGSYASGVWKGKDYGGDVEKREELKEQGILKETPDKRLLFADDSEFNHISAAAKVIVGRNANGLDEWKIKGSDKTFREWKAGQPD